MKQLVAVVLSLTAAIGLASGHVNAQDAGDDAFDLSELAGLPIEIATIELPTALESGTLSALEDTSPVIESDDLTFSVDLGGTEGPRVPSQSVVLIILITLLAVAPSLLIMLTSFTRIVIVFSLLRNALGLGTTPPNQIIVGLSLFLTLFIMGPTLQESYDEGVKPFMDGAIEQDVAFDAAMSPFRDFMSANVGAGELELMLGAASIDEPPATPDDIPLRALIPAFILSELKTAFLIGFIVFVPFLVIDIVTSASLMSLGMMMMPPPMVSLPLKILLLVMVDGWVLISETLLTGFNF